MLLVISGMRSYIALNGLKMLKHWEQIKQEYLLEIIFEKWMKLRNRWDSFTWRIDIIAKRISFLMSNMSFFYNTADEDFQKNLQSY